MPAEKDRRKTDSGPDFQDRPRFMERKQEAEHPLHILPYDRHVVSEGFRLKPFEKRIILIRNRREINLKPLVISAHDAPSPAAVAAEAAFAAGAAEAAFAAGAAEAAFAAGAAEAAFAAGAAEAAFAAGAAEEEAAGISPWKSPYPAV
jgi:hypothetical protein